MTKDREQLTPIEPDDGDKIRPRRSAAREATEPSDSSTGPGPASRQADPKAADEVDGSQKPNYR